MQQIWNWTLANLIPRCMSQLPVVSAAWCSQLSLQADVNANCISDTMLRSYSELLAIFFFNDQACISVVFSILPFLFSPVHLCGGLLKQSGSWMGKNKLCNLKMACPYSKQVLIQTAEGEASPPHFLEIFDFRSRVTVLYSSFAEPPSLCQCL